ncbi:hypothetical protein LVY74_02025 [Acinetobacter sp. ME22]|uniref:hypothetical protein n=1 Tax=Acinetobacter sp. ME22 TaxID=2904802 RepID=UPI001EDC3BF6|nr:hypothetical protein [Acinetobacter sp. ME22]MCG2572334.1 hypothetical protein [Acinetobacter sp. ME22]
MNDFFLAKNGQMILPLNEVEYAVGQVCMRDFDKWLSFSEPVKKFINGRELTDDLLNELTQDFFGECVSLCQIVVKDFVVDLSCLLHIASFIAVVIQANQAYFAEKEDEPKAKPKKKQSEKKDKTTWFDSFQILVSHGHSHESIMNMTYGAFTEYLKAIKRRDQEQMIQQVNLMRIAYSADGAGFSKFIHDMQCG